ncbi:hypothetical protein [Micromonospora parathelypteridis]|uniref:Oxidoreductase n=1 Tax=Micromonospora parathelypteridis TaxID=1839617 RepID=A0A840VVK7_9ACTN|nr:hypothetical protein [Micromonospora parathelypteridis]MBB5481363.1 hypothetical protein [Micromonospora parathelypteridis]GGO18885.1 hypothetical protein GCM10011576_34320 [Micromonospora parathelypteridis]
MTSVGAQRVRDANGATHSPAEQRLIESVARGEVLDLVGDRPVDEEAMRSWGDDHAISASVIRELVRGRLVSEPDPHGLRLRGARIVGRIDLENVTSDLALELRDCLLPDGVNLRNARLSAVALSGCRIEQAPDSADAALEATRCAAWALSLDRSTVSADAAAGAIRLAAARVGTLDCRGARWANSTGPALDADGLTVDQSVFLNDGFTATSPSVRGTVRLLGAHIGGQLNCGGARLENTVGPALNADNLRADQDVLLSHGFSATSASAQGTIRLISAHIGSLSAGGARLTNTAGPVLDADGLTVDRDVALDRGFTASSASAWGAVGLAGAHIGGLLTCGAARLENTIGPAVDLNGLRVDQDVLLDDGFSATSGGDEAVVLVLAGARVGGTLRLDTDRVARTAPGPGPLVELEGLTYSGLPRPASLRHWLTLLREHTPRYSAQPYQHLAAAYRAAGHDRDARTILIAQRRDQLHRAGLSAAERAWGRLTGITLGYGYQPWRALLLLLATLAVAVALSVVGGHHGGLAQKPLTSGAAAACTSIDQIGVGLDLGAPLLKTGARDRCQPTDTAAGQTLTIAGWLLQLFAWSFATLFIAGFTSAVRKT